MNIFKCTLTWTFVWTHVIHLSKTQDYSHVNVHMHVCIDIADFAWYIF